MTNMTFSYEQVSTTLNTLRFRYNIYMLLPILSNLARRCAPSCQQKNNVRDRAIYLFIAKDYNLNILQIVGEKKLIKLFR